MEQNQTKLPVLFWVIAVIALIWNLMGVAAFLFDMFISEEALAAMDEAKRSLYENSPIFQKIVFGLSVFSGLLGSIGLLMRKSWAVPLFLLSLICVILQLIISVVATDAVKILGATSLIMPSIVILIAAFLYWHSRNAERSGQIF